MEHHSPLTDEQFKLWKELQGNFTLTPTYFDLVKGIWNVIVWYYRPIMWKGYTFPQSFIDDLTRHFYFPFHQTCYIVFIAIFITFLRYFFERKLCKPIANWLELTRINKKKFPESTWKCFFYTTAWLFNFYLLNYRYHYFQEPFAIWDDWESGMEIPFDIKFMYFVQCGFYLHSIYGTIYMDSKRKDFVAMLIHHVLTMTLIFVSYATRYHKIGLLVLFVHDITDIWLELAKTLHYLSSREGNREYPAWETAANGCFILFILCWFLFRLYWYPLKVLYSTGVVTAYTAYGRGCGLYAFFNSLLWILLGLNIYWLVFILQFLFRLFAANERRLEDTRDNVDDDDEDTASQPVKTSNTTTAQEKKNTQKNLKEEIQTFSTEF